MLIKGRYNEAVVYTDVIEESAVEQLRALCDDEAFAGCKIRIMPDVHTGAGCTIGTTMTLHGRAVPNMVGVDIGCGMEVVRLKERAVDLAALDAAVYARIPSGRDVREQPHPYAREIDLSQLRCYKYIRAERAERSIGTLGGGNHFIEADRDEEGNLYFVVHSGSRHLGTEVAGWYQEEAYRRLCGNSRAQIDALIRRLKEEGRAKEIQAAVQRALAERSETPPQLAYAEGDLFDDYIHDMKIVQRFAVLNRQAMTDELVRAVRVTVEEQFTTIHNYIDTEHMILRKGAVSAQKGEKLLIPINMRDGALICVGKGNEEWNCSAPHGAGRLLSRGKALHTLTMEEFRKSMEGIYTTSVSEKTLDESPMAYKRLEDIVGNISSTVDIVRTIRPVYNFKAAN